MENKNITIDDLAGMVQKGFEETAKKDEVNERFDKIEIIAGRFVNVAMDNQTRHQTLF